MPRSDYKTLCLLKCSLCQVRRLKSHKFFNVMAERRGRLHVAVHDVREVTGKEALATDKLLWELNEKSKHTSLSDMRS